MKNSAYGHPQPPEESSTCIVPIPLESALVTSPTRSPKCRKSQQAVGDGQEKVKLEPVVPGKPQLTSSSRGRSTSSNAATGPSTRQKKRRQKDPRIAASTALEEVDVKDLAETGVTRKPVKAITDHLFTISTHFITLPFAYPCIPEFQDINATSSISSSVPPTPAVVQQPLPQDAAQCTSGSQVIFVFSAFLAL
ncbi:hypothetical protein JAAARDRAFT_197089 [Jaapia argillacea MUCL 33604]|uniref:Uncharacterized protein n=1 Tax=Jaapia argillacea MUCL 33604 TaxID=933084 RepID=A0A067PUI3_9AGAM|nr:hypothetical protein JAAARDRAFT_197089 [Jaapia argillacea MUCL 33604]